MNTWKLLLLRHGKSSWADPHLEDVDRPLKKRGWRATKRMGRFIKQEGILPQCIYASTAKRVEQTTDRLLKGIGKEIDIVWKPELYHASIKTIHEILSQQPAPFHCILMIGHNPGMEDYLHWLDPRLDWPQDGKLFPTAALAEITANKPYAHWRPGEVMIQRITRPRQLVLADD